ncbi:MAG TPA: diguanylate cyclase [Methylophaga sp.]|nr:diguanylate cyclase [Methylophaga sp.]
MVNKTEQANTAVISQAGFLDQLATQWQWAIDNEASISLFLIDVDHFDEIRHKSGCVKIIIGAIDGILQRENDFITCFNRKKIMFLTSGMSYQQTRQLADRLHQVVGALNLRKIEGDMASPAITVSIGHITYTPITDGNYGILDILSNLIKLCQQAKLAGGNCSKTRLHSQILR